MEALPLGKQDFSLVLGGPLYQLFRRAHLSGPVLEQLWRRIWVITLVAWLPLLVLSAAAGHAVGPPSALPFLRDIEAQVRFLVALPVMIAAELVVHRRTRGVVAQFLDRGIVRAADVPRFEAALASALRLRNSIVLEVGLLVLVATAGPLDLEEQHRLRPTELARDAGRRWPASHRGGRLVRGGQPAHHPVHPAPLVPAALRLVPLPLAGLTPGPAPGPHPSGPDCRPGVPRARAPMPSGRSSSRRVRCSPASSRPGCSTEGETLLAFKVDVLGLVGLLLLLLLAPLTVFTPQLAQAKLAGLAAYGKLGSEYVEAFEGKWIRAEAAHAQSSSAPPTSSRWPTSGQSYTVIREMNVVPFAMQDVTRLAVTTAAPLLPLVLTVILPRRAGDATPEDPALDLSPPHQGDAHGSAQRRASVQAQATMLVPPSTYTVPPVMRRAKGVAR